MTGNNLPLSDEITRRAGSIRIDAKTDRPWEGRTYRHPDLVCWLKRHRHDVIWACLVLVRHWLARGRPDWTGQPMGSYESWCRVLGGILETAGISGFLENRRELYRRGDVDSEEWRAFTSSWWEQHRTTPVKVAELQPIAE
ncbi:MAG: ATPase, partial [Dehalococcoidia bacterium]